MQIKANPFSLPLHGMVAWLGGSQKQEVFANIARVLFCGVIADTGPSISTGWEEVSVQQHQRLVSTCSKFGHPQTCGYPDVCLGTGDVSGKAPLQGQGAQ